MAIAALIVKMMPQSPQTDLHKMKEEAQHKLEGKGARNITFEENPIGFGLKALMVKFAWPEEKPTEEVESVLSSVSGVSSVSIEDYRRAFG